MAAPNWDRRTFIEALGGVTAGALVAPQAAPAAPQAAVPTAAIGARPPAPAWCDEPMRWAQLTLVENDPGRFDLAFWLDYFRRTHADAACLSAGGCVAYYPTEVPFHHRSAWLGDRDPFGELVAGCRALGMVVIARTDPHATLRRRRARASRLDRGRRRRTAAPPLGLPRDVGHLRPRALQLRVHDRGAPRDRDALRRRRHLHQPLGRPGDVLLRALPAQLPRRHRRRPAPHERRRRIPCAAPTSPGARSGSSSSGRSWDAEVRRDRGRTPASSPTGRPTCAPPARSQAPDAVRRPPGPPRADAAVGERQGAARSTAP